jgi:hypothetical protein
MNGFGWIPPSEERRELNARYPFALLGLESIPASISVQMAVPDLWDYYDQKATPRCVAFSSQFMSSTYAYNYHLAMGMSPKQALGMITKYDTSWLWKAIGGTSQGAIIEDALDVLRRGDVIAGTGVQSSKEGIANYVHISSAEDIRTAAANGKCGILGIPWHGKWMTAVDVFDDNPKSWERIVGYHAIMWEGWDDSIDGTYARNSWGKAWTGGKKTMFTRKAIDYMLRNENAEGYVVTDIPVAPIPPVVTDTKSITLVDDKTGEKWTGKITKA